MLASCFQLLFGCRAAALREKAELVSSPGEIQSRRAKPGARFLPKEPFHGQTQSDLVNAEIILITGESVKEILQPHIPLGLARASDVLPSKIRHRITERQNKGTATLLWPETRLLLAT